MSITIYLHYSKATNPGEQSIVRMNKIRQIQELNKRELEAGISPNASWHTDYRDTAYIYIGGLPFELSEGDILTIFSQYGEPTYINLIRDKETGKSRGFAFLKYEDQRSTDLAVDNLSGMVITGRTISVDHTRYKLRDDGEDTGIDLTKEAEDEGEERRKRRRVSGESDTDVEEETNPKRPMIREERELEALKRDHDDDDPMKGYLIKEKEEEVSIALAKLENGSGKKREKSGHKSRHQHRSKRDDKARPSRRSRSREYRDEDERRQRRRSRNREARDGRTRRRSPSREDRDTGGRRSNR